MRHTGIHCHITVCYRVKVTSINELRTCQQYSTYLCMRNPGWPISGYKLHSNWDYWLIYQEPIKCFGKPDQSYILKLLILFWVQYPMSFHLLSDDKQMKQTVLYKKMEPDSIFSLQIDKWLTTGIEDIFSLLTNLTEMSCESILHLLQDHKLDWQLPKQTEGWKSKCTNNYVHQIIESIILWA